MAKKGGSIHNKHRRKTREDVRPHSPAEFKKSAENEADAVSSRFSFVDGQDVREIQHFQGRDAAKEELKKTKKKFPRVKFKFRFVLSKSGPVQVGHKADKLSRGYHSHESTGDKSDQKPVISVLSCNAEGDETGLAHLHKDRTTRAWSKDSGWQNLELD